MLRTINSSGILSRRGVVIARLAELSGTLQEGELRMIGKVVSSPGFWVAEGVEGLTLDYIVYPQRSPHSWVLACDTVAITRYEHPRIWLSGQTVRPSKYVGDLPAAVGLTA